MDETNISKTVQDGQVNASTQSPASLAYMKARQCAKIAELHTALVNAGLVSLDSRAKALGLSRSTTWAVLKGSHKTSGLSATVINRIVLSPQLPASARVILFQYVEEKSAGAYGHSHQRLQIFRKQLRPITASSNPTWNGLGSSSHRMGVTAIRRFAIRDKQHSAALSAVKEIGIAPLGTLCTLRR